MIATLIMKAISTASPPDSECPPVKIRHIKQIITNEGQLAIVAGDATFAPVVVIADTTVNSNSIGTISDRK